eukprot:GHVU01219647.1.p1 GENE.GHVU01219647.1~~GHVU01219647.1.p1  ORF type:complete len:287 (+),score=35.26 GHVU01219647.1:127-987(+)
MVKEECEANMNEGLDYLAKELFRPDAPSWMVKVVKAYVGGLPARSDSVRARNSMASAFFYLRDNSIPTLGSKTCCAVEKDLLNHPSLVEDIDKAFFGENQAEQTSGMLLGITVPKIRWCGDKKCAGVMMLRLLDKISNKTAREGWSVPKFLRKKSFTLAPLEGRTVSEDQKKIDFVRGLAGLPVAAASANFSKQPLEQSAVDELSAPAQRVCPPAGSVSHSCTSMKDVVKSVLVRAGTGMVHTLGDHASLPHGLFRNGCVYAIVNDDGVYPGHTLRNPQRHQENKK